MYREHVQPGHTLVREVFGDFVAADFDAVAAALSLLDRKFVYRSVRGKDSFDVHRRRLREQPARRWGINCFDYSCLAVSYFRAVGWSAQEVFVASCDILDSEGETVVDFHCCVLLRRGDTLGWIDPCDSLLVRTDPAKLFASYKLHLIFNDRHVYLHQVEKERIVNGQLAASGLRICLFGDRDPQVCAMLDDARLHSFVHAFFAESALPEPVADEAFLQHAQAAEVIVDREGRPVPGPRLLTVRRATELAIYDLVAPLVDRYLSIVSRTVPVLKRAYEGCALAERYSWLEVEHAVVAGLLMDLSVGARLEIRDEVTQAFGEAVLWAFENVTAANAFGVQWFAAATRRGGLGQLWHRDTKRASLSLAPAVVDSLTAFVVDGNEPPDERHWQYLRYLKLARGSRRDGELTVPAFHGDTARRLLEPLSAAAAALVDEVVEPGVRLAEEEAWAGEVGAGTYSRHTTIRLLLEYAGDRVVDAGLVRAFPRGTPAVAWGRWVWVEPGDGPGLTPRLGVAIAPPGKVGG